MPVQPLEEIEIYVLAEQIADKRWQIVSRWKPFAQDTVGKQLLAPKLNAYIKSKKAQKANA